MEEFEERQPYEPPMIAEAGDFAVETRGPGGLVPDDSNNTPH